MVNSSVVYCSLLYLPQYLIKHLLILEELLLIYGYRIIRHQNKSKKLCLFIDSTPYTNKICPHNTNDNDNSTN
jgi:hypothetical protein